jgi:hypothetical protein
MEYTMEFKEENFPLYALLKNNKSNDGIVRDFQAAVSGGDEDKFAFAVGLDVVCAYTQDAQIPGVTSEIRTKTHESCQQVIKDVAQGTSSAAVRAQKMLQD